LANISTLSTGPRVVSGASLAQLQRSGIFVEWYEAVAIVQELICTIVQSGNDRTTDPDPNKVFITKTGEVKANLTPARSPFAAIQCLGKVLSGLLPNNDPMALKLRVVAKAVSQPPAYDTLDALADALAYYERPNRAEQIRAVYDRWKDRPPLPDVTEPEIRPEAPPKHAPAGRQRSSFVGVKRAAITVLAAIVGIGAWTLKSRFSRFQQDESVATATADPIDPPADVVLERTTRLPHSNVPKASGSQAPSTIGSAERSNDSGRRESQLASRPDYLVQGSSQPDPEPLLNSVSSFAEREQGLPDDYSVAAVNETTLTASNVDTVTYGADDVDVVKPTAIYPKFLNAPRRTRGHERVLAFEVVINAAGTVDSVRPKDLPHNLGELILVTNALSAAKSWRFWPALKQGGPVRYRQSVALVAY
jgi:hypothetical protein